MNLLYLYNATQTYTSTVFEHISSLQKYSVNHSFFAHHDQYSGLEIDLSQFEGVALHYSIRLPYDQIHESTAIRLAQYDGLKILFIQDEYDNTHRAWHWIKRLGIRLVFTVVPEQNISVVYPPEQFPGVRFVNVLTGYVPEELHAHGELPPSQRSLIVGYRGRPLPVRYGELGWEKVTIGKATKQYCVDNAIQHDIAWTEEARIYGSGWYEFMSSCRSMLGAESGSNVFDWDGTLPQQVSNYIAAQGGTVEDKEIYDTVIKPHEIPGLMNQVSPRIFEAVACRTVLVLYEGTYSDVVLPGKHFIPLKKDGSNMEEIFSRLADGVYVDAMADQAYKDIIASKKYSYESFVALVDSEIDLAFKAFACANNPTMHHTEKRLFVNKPSPITTSPIRAAPPRVSTDTLYNTIFGANTTKEMCKRFMIYLWWKLPKFVRFFLAPRLKRLLGRD
jgi:hypothetical protein